MKNSLLLILFCLSFAAFSQNEPPKLPKYNAKNAAGIFYYNILEAEDKIKLKKDERKVPFSKALRKYNNKIKDISFLNSTNLNDVDLTVNSNRTKAFKDPEIANKLRKIIVEKVAPVKDSIEKVEKVLNGELKTFLSKRQFKRWLRYQRSQKEKLQPERPQNNQNRNGPNNSMMRRRGMGGLGGGRRF